MKGYHLFSEKRSIFKVFNNRQNIKNSIIYLGISILIMLFAQSSSLPGIMENDPVKMMTIPLTLSFIGAISIFLSGLFIQVLWRNKFNYGYSVQFASVAILNLSLLSLFASIFSKVISEQYIYDVSLFLFFIVSLIQSTVCSKNLIKRSYELNSPEEDEEFDDPLEEIDINEIEKENHHEVSRFQKVLSIAGNLFKCHMVLFVYFAIISGAAQVVLVSQ